LSLGQKMPRTLRSPRQKALIALLIEQRKKSGLTQAQLAKRLRRYQSFVATVESGQRRIDVIEFLDLADAIGFDAIDAIKKLRASVRSQ
jgi:transcriptional regulator with XRE-family HTH domain